MSENKYIRILVESFPESYEKFIKEFKVNLERNSLDLICVSEVKECVVTIEKTREYDNYKNCMQNSRTVILETSDTNLDNPRISYYKVEFEDLPHNHEEFKKQCEQILQGSHLQLIRIKVIKEDVIPIQNEKNYRKLCSQPQTIIQLECQSISDKLIRTLKSENNSLDSDRIISNIVTSAINSIKRKLIEKLIPFGKAEDPSIFFNKNFYHLCSECNQSIFDIIYSCMQCTNYHLCNVCEDYEVHNHEMIKRRLIKKSKTEQIKPKIFKTLQCTEQDDKCNSYFTFREKLPRIGQLINRFPVGKRILSIGDSIQECLKI